MGDLKVYNYSQEELDKFKIATIKTEKGDMKLNLFSEDAPNTVSNFATLANDGFYNNLSFHRVIDDFVAQGGCPDGTGAGGPGYSIACELENNSKEHTRGALSMAHAGRDTGGSQFFVCLADTPHLNGEHTVFGAIDKNDEESFKVLDSISENDKIISVVIS
jgi:cyclophilin family peptidyl-prolyl cis-trans isomerase